MNLQISRRDTALLKGFAILAIVLHNYCHWIPGVAVENEYNFYVTNSRHLLDTLLNFGPHVFMSLFSYFGCYGVPVFLFISGYGMVKKYENGGNLTDGGVGAWRFIRYNALKLWRLMAVGVVLLFIYEEMFTTGWRHGFMNVVWLFTFLTNFFPQQATSVLPRQDLLLGPWWYFSLTMQMYLLYRLAFYRRGKREMIVAASVCVVLQVLAVTAFDSPAQTMLHYLRYTLLGCLLPFVLGTWASRYGLRLSRRAYIISVVVFVGGMFSVYAWIAAPAALALMAVPLVRIRNEYVRRPFEWLGRISAALFVVHPIVRCFLNPRLQGNVYLMFFEYIALSVLAAWVITKLLNLLPRPRL